MDKTNQKSHSASKVTRYNRMIVHDLFSKFDAQNLPYPTIWKMTIEKWVRLCTSCGNNVKFTPIKSSPNCFTSFAQCHEQNVIKKYGASKIHLSGYFMGSKQRMMMAV